jgi:hypothetical protein
LAFGSSSALVTLVTQERNLSCGGLAKLAAVLRAARRAAAVGSKVGSHTALAVEQFHIVSWFPCVCQYLSGLA